MDKEFKPSCFFCGAAVGEISQRTEQTATAIYDCEKCRANFCDQCSYAQNDKSNVQCCLKCDSVIEKVS